MDRCGLAEWLALWETRGCGILGFSVGFGPSHYPVGPLFLPSVARVPPWYRSYIYRSVQIYTRKLLNTGLNLSCRQAEAREGRAVVYPNGSRYSTVRGQSCGLFPRGFSL